ncbi:Phosphoacetylglucosamine mutase [Lamellibrachia satsuma]|nr:Phosphoacetylglucosamine mutase [Lamellibrachia satsuma]
MADSLAGIRRCGKFFLVDGDKIATLVAGYLKELVLQSALELKFGLVQTAYANGSSTDYINNKLNVHVACAPTGVKYLHHEAMNFDIGVYFEANGHGTVLFSDAATRKIQAAAANQNLLPEQKMSAARLSTVVDLINQTVGDAISDLLLVETILHARGWSIADWNSTYTELPNRQVKVKPGRKLRGGKVTGHKETGRKETGRKGTGGKTTGVKERGVGETGGKEKGVGETGGKTTGVKERGVAETGGKEKGVGETGGKTTGVKERGVGETGGKEKGVGEMEGKTTGVKERGVGETRAKEWEVGETGGKGSGQNVMEVIERKSYSAAVIEGVRKRARVFVGDSIVRKTDRVLNKGDDVVVCLPGAKIEAITERVADRNVIQTTDAERKVTTPGGLQGIIDAIVSKYPHGRSFVRPSGTEDVVRVYSEAETQAAADELAYEVSVAVFQQAGGIGDPPQPVAL